MDGIVGTSRSVYIKCDHVNQYRVNSVCSGLGEPSYFYIESVFFLNGLNMAVFFLFGTFLR